LLTQFPPPQYDASSRCGSSLSHCVAHASPSQCMAYYADRRNERNLASDVVEASYTTSIESIITKIGVVSDREALYRSAIFRDGETYMNVGYSTEDIRRPAVSGLVRVDLLYCFLVREEEGSGGHRSECWRFNVLDPKFRKGFGFMNKLAADKASEMSVKPLETLKVNVERLIMDHQRPSVEEVAYEGYNR
jgi:hypothetical protein